MSEWRELTEGMIVCELCSRYYTPQSFSGHLSQHSKKDVELLGKLSQKTLDMTSEQYREFTLEPECEAYRRARESTT
jgi:hypothetical protein